MSLFKIRQFWSTTSEDDEYFDQNSLIVDKLNFDFDYIITASQSGVLRIFYPSCDINEGGNLGEFDPNDVIVEKIFNAPILQIGCGRLASGSQSSHLAVLHPTLLSVYALIIKTGKTDHGNQSYLHLLYEHKLRKSASNFAIGPFGGSQNRDFICVQSLDGLLSFFEQESQVSYIALPDFLLPGPIGYVIKTDSFITTSSDWGIVSYKYKALSEASEESIDPIYSKQKITSDWHYNLGELAIDVAVINDIINKETWIAVLGERNLFCFNGSGKMKFMKKLDYCPICFYVYVVESNIFTLVIAETNVLLVYENTALKWSAHIDYLPTAIHRAFLKNIKGALVLLTEEGRLECCYLGTEPSFFVAPPLNVQEIDYEKAEQELLDLEKVIKSSNSSDVTVQSNIEKELQLNVFVNKNIEICTFEHSIKNAASNYMCAIAIDILPLALFQEVQIALLVQKPLKVVPNSYFYSNLTEKTSLTCHVFLNEAFEVPTLCVEVKASVISSLGVPRTLTKNVMLPMSLILEVCSPEKENKHKITLTTNQSPVGLATLFSEYSDSDQLTQPNNAIAFKSASGSTATILLAKSSERYRLQSDSFASLSVMAEQIILRLKGHHSKNNDYRISFNSPLPANEVFHYVNDHFEIKQKINELQEDLCQISGQFRLIQKRLISKFKAKNPTPLKSLELLLNDTYSDISQITEKLENELENLSKSQTDLSCSVHLIKQLVGLLGIDNDLLNMINSAFCTRIYDVDLQAWEDVMDAALCYLLRTVLAKTDKDRLRAPHTSFEEVKDISKVEKHLSQVLERLPKQTGVSQRRNSVFEEDSQKESKAQEEEVIEIPIGSQFGESSIRLLSARKSLLRKRHKNNDTEDQGDVTYNQP